ncbi:hypothetical protein DevBK_11820 [Devosia sp. BK]|uniref:hypothetical protein n=1 Tax=unclassified Devosia TaxID=196773 RepID=UPI000714128B|nr:MULTISPECIES: hypothetical protein [unclassified Devosia]KQT50248.1 hypothetical protein ASG47_19870 [Devosia sp. Leaf420]MDV3252021.1 hypothetical protein [Devosia sp. BK]
MPYLEDWDMPVEKKREYLESVWRIMSAFVHIALDNRPERSAPKAQKDRDKDRTKSEGPPREL